MEFKTLFYIVAIIAWLVFQFLEKRKSLLKKISQPLEPTVNEQNLPPIEPIIKKPAKVPVIKSSVKPSRESYSSHKIENKRAEIIHEIKPEEELKEVDEQHSIIEEIRGGNVDWRKAIVLSEILRPV